MLSSRAGLAVVCGPRVRKAVVPSPRSVLDLVPTILAMLGVPHGQDMEGRPWLDVLPADVKSESVETWDTDVETESQDGLDGSRFRRAPIQTT